MRREPNQRYFLVTQDDLYKIDCMLGVLNLALSEILERRPVDDHSGDPTPAQDEYDEHINAVVDTTVIADDERRQTRFDF
jgi:hypothetical protein